MCGLLSDRTSWSLSVPPVTSRHDARAIALLPQQICEPDHQGCLAGATDRNIAHNDQRHLQVLAMQPANPYSVRRTAATVPKIRLSGIESDDGTYPVPEVFEHAHRDKCGVGQRNGSNKAAMSSAESGALASVPSPRTPAARAAFDACSAADLLFHAARHDQLVERTPACPDLCDARGRSPGFPRWIPPGIVVDHRICRSQIQPRARPP